MEEALLWAKAQFALTAMYHWLFVPLTLGLGIIISIMETKYFLTKDEQWRQITKFWMRLFGVNFAVGVATGLILEFQFGTNWSNYSWFVGDIFGAPLAIEGIVAFFMEATFIAVMFFGWDKVSRGFHLTSTWMTVVGASISALWILIANAWMQYPVGMEFNPDTVRNEMVSVGAFWSVVSSPVAINKYLHCVLSSWMVGATFVIGVCAWFILKGRHKEMCKRSVAIAAPFGIIAMLLTMMTGDGSAYNVAQKQPMKLAAMEGLYNGGEEQGLIAFGILDPTIEINQDDKESCLFSIEIPYALSYLAYRDHKAFVPGINDILQGGYQLPSGEIALSAQQKMDSGKKALTALKEYKEAKAIGDTQEANRQHQIIDDNYQYLGYGYITAEEQLVPNVGLVFYAFHIMVVFGCALMALFILSWWFNRKGLMAKNKWFLYISMLCIPVSYIASQAGWVTAEVGRQPWVIEGIMPTMAAISDISAGSVKFTFMLFCIIFTTLLIAELGIMIKQIKKGL